MTSADLSKRPEEVSAMFDQVAPGYDRTNTVMTFGQVGQWRQATTRAVAPRPGERVLDLAAGTGTSSVPFHQAGADVVSADFSEGMLAEGRRRYPFLTFEWADATALPFDDDSFDAVTISYGLRNVVDMDTAMSEALRVLKPGGRYVICEFSTPTWRPFATVYDWWLGNVLPRLAQLASTNDAAYPYLSESIEAWPDQRSLARHLRAAGFEHVQWRNLSGGIVALHRAWKPAAKDED
ncbi:demethylmenaquinone methyltransferase [Pseudoclavibacter sp. 13-3]|uniref:demethylmenaquinone methyltransferase n=1 Tax=Pseudoclavibacter sp. 13-3 TaxID=2901228 RepID=UPI001E2E705B|nr:demethylmenaquinone methyltransferase [Pseudoclavibacter sp. 13-3]